MVYAELFKRWIGVALVIAGVVATGLAWSGQSLRGALAALLR